MHAHRISIPLAALAIVAGCAPTPLGARRRGLADHGDQETRSSALAIADEWGRGSDGWVVSPALAAPEGATRVSAFVTLLAPGELPAIEARGLAGGDPVTDWTPLGAFFAEAGSHVAHADLPVLADAAQIRVREPSLEAIAELRWSAIVPDDATEDAAMDEGSDATGVAGVRAEPLRMELRGMGIVPREDWGARATDCGPVDGSRHRISIHHTEGPSSDPMRQLRGIQSYHISKGWCDIGYHFLIDASGTIYEGRPVELRGTHVRSNNSGNLGIAFIGCFDARECSAPTTISDAMIESAGRLVGSLGRLYAIAPSATSVRGHRDQVATTCPGDRLYARIGDIVDVARGSTLDDGTTPPAPEPPPPAGASCAHSLGGAYGDRACSAAYQCCGGAWRERARGCGSCACVEESGRVGCAGGSDPPVVPPPEPPPAPAGAACAHGFGGTYAHTACSASYQCCDGSWRARASGCATCLCVEESGTIGCGGAATPPPSSSVHAGLTQSGSEIPRAGLANPTLRSALGVSVEPLGTVESFEGVDWVRGRVSWFGGPDDTGVTSTETGAISGERLRDLNDPLAPSPATLASRPEDYYYVAMRWSYTPNGARFWRAARLVVVDPATGARVVVRPVDWGPHTRTGRVLDLSPQALVDLGLDTDAEALVAFAAPGTPLGPVR